MAVNLRQLSALLGLSQTTVSRALNGYPEVNAERASAFWPPCAKRATGRTAPPATGDGARLFDRPRHADRGRHGQRHPLRRFLAGLAEEAVRHDFHFVINPAAPAEEEATFRRLAASGNVDALFIAYMRAQDPRIDILKSLSIPFIVHGRAIGGARDYPYIDIDNTGAFYDATLCCCSSAPRFCLINGPGDLTFAIRRKKGMVRRWERPGSRSIRRCRNSRR